MTPPADQDHHEYREAGTRAQTLDEPGARARGRDERLQIVEQCVRRMHREHGLLRLQPLGRRHHRPQVLDGFASVGAGK